MRPTSVTVGSATSSAWIPVNYHQNPFNVGIYVSGTGTNTSKVELTFDDVFDPSVTPVAFAAPSASGLESISAASAEAGVITYPCRAVRLTISSYTSGNATMIVTQGT